jgi:hypothetical protein
MFLFYFFTFYVAGPLYSSMCALYQLKWLFIVQGLRSVLGIDGAYMCAEGLTEPLGFLGACP